MLKLKIEAKKISGNSVSIISEYIALWPLRVEDLISAKKIYCFLQKRQEENIDAKKDKYFLIGCFNLLLF